MSLQFKVISPIILFFLYLFIIPFLISCEFVSNHDHNKTFVPTRPELQPNNPKINAQKYGDIYREQDQDFINAINDPSLTAVTREFGLSKISIKEFPYSSEFAIADVKPWSSWWYPKREKNLFDNSKVRSSKDYKNFSTLSKFDLIKKNKNKNAPSAAAYEKTLYNPNALSWEGLCDAWSIASILFPEPKRSVTINLNNNYDIIFEVKDLKALLLKTFESVDDQYFKYYGQKFSGQENAWIYPDIFPEQFHRFLEVQLFEKHKAFIIDTDQGVEMWNAPVFKANYTMTRIPDEPNSIFVRTWIYLADSIKTDDHNFVGTKEVVREYDYVLKGDRDSNGDLIVNLGYWVKGPNNNDSRRDHPDFIILPPDIQLLKRKSWNPEIDIETVDEILSTSY